MSTVNKEKWWAITKGDIWEKETGKKNKAEKNE
jgi:hypothetical protein